MKTKIFLAMGLMASVYGYGQVDTYAEPLGVTNPAVDAGDQNVHIGHSAGAASNSSTDFNVFVGFEAGLSNDAGKENTFIGCTTGKLNEAGGSNTFVGYQSGVQNQNGDFNTFLGYRAGKNSVLNSNTYVGSSAGRDNTGYYNTMVGVNAGILNVTGYNNTIFGSEAGKSCTGSENTFLGYHSGFISTGNNNVFIGHNAGAAVTSGDNLLYVANSNTSNPLIYGQFDPNTDSTVEGILKFNAQKVGIGFETSTMGFGLFPTMAGVANAANYRLFVRGGILAEEVRIRLQGQWPDYVFSSDYNLLSLKETEKFIAQNGHLPNMPSAADVKEQGLEMGNIVKLQQEKIEELTLHAIEQEKRLDSQQREIEALKEQNKQMEELKQQVEILLEKQ